MCSRVMTGGEYTGAVKKRPGIGGTGELSRANSPGNYAEIGFQRDVQSVSPRNSHPICPSISNITFHGFGNIQLEAASRSASFTGRPAGEELIRSGAINRTDFAKVMAKIHNIEYSNAGPAPDQLTGCAGYYINSGNGVTHVTQNPDFFGIATEYRGWQEKPKIFVACDPAASSVIAKLVAHPAIANSQISLTTRKALNYCQFVAGSARHLNNAITGLSRHLPEFSASRVITRMQVWISLSLILGAISAGLFWPTPTLLLLHLVAAIFYLSVTFMRAAMIIPGSILVTKEPVLVANTISADSELPLYTIMVALYKEAGQVDDLVASLKKINWPRDRLQILLICEADDPETIAQCQKHNKDERFQTVICPVSQPRTKPKALNYALCLATGEFLVLYDAEDRPHRDQLREAHVKFGNSPDTACLQAPLVIHNDRQSWFTRLFAIEYLTQFYLILPVLEKWGSPIPLGGTSNHFRTRVLRKVGAWDPHNVTEDADLGIRLARFGYNCGTLRLETLEEAPPVFNVWFKQRTRWIKGWLQTFLVHMRNPMKLSREMGIRKTLFFHLVITAIVVSVLIHPFFVISAIYHAFLLAGDSQMNAASAGLLGINVFNLVGGYSTYFAICWLALEAKHRNYLRSSIIWLPFYWLLISLAGWRAIWQLFTNPFLWEKTDHGLAHDDLGHGLNKSHSMTKV